MPIYSFIDRTLTPALLHFKRTTLSRYADFIGSNYNSYVLYLSEAISSPFIILDDKFFDHKRFLVMENDMWERADEIIYEIVNMWHDAVVDAVTKLDNDNIIQSIISRGRCLRPSGYHETTLLSDILRGILILPDMSLGVGGSYRYYSRDLGFPHIRMHYSFLEIARELVHVIVEDLCTRGLADDGIPIFDLGCYRDGSGVLGEYDNDFILRFRLYLKCLKTQHYTRRYSGKPPLTKRAPLTDLEIVLRSIGANLSLGVKGFIYLHELGHFVYGHSPFERRGADEPYADGFALWLLSNSHINQRGLFLVSVEIALILLIYAADDDGRYSLRQRLNIVHQYRKSFMSKSDLTLDVFIVPVLKVMLTEGLIGRDYFDERLRECDLSSRGLFEDISYSDLFKDTARHVIRNDT